MDLLKSVSVLKFALPWKSLAANCANPDCKPASVLQNLTGKREGVRIGENWYCSADCFEEAARERLAELCWLDMPMELQHRFRMPLGLVLLGRGVINKKQLQVLLAEQRRNGGKVGEILVRFGYASEEQVTAAAAAQWSCPVFSLKDRLPETEIELPCLLLEMHSILPVHYLRTTNKLMVGFVHQIDHNLLYAIEQMTQTATIPCFITPSDFRLQIRGLASSFRNEEITFDSVQSTLEMARIVRNYAVQLGALTARFTRCHNYVWSRVEGRRRRVELLFRLPGR